MTHAKSILFVCLGNICRSPTAEAVMRAKAQQLDIELVIDSAGTTGYHAGESPDTRARKAGEQRGYSFAGIKARGVQDEDFERFDLILAMDQKNLADLFERCPDDLQHKCKLLLGFRQPGPLEVPDPYYGGAKGFELVLDLVEQACERILEEIRPAVDA